MAAVGALHLGFKVKPGLARGKHLPAGLHADEASYVSASSVSAFRAAIVRSVWSCKMPLANTPAVLNLLDGLVGVDPAYHIVWALVSISSVPVSEGIEIRQGCRFIRSLFRALGKLPGGYW